MTIEAWISILSLCVIGLISTGLVLYPHYEDGILGRAALSVMAVICLGVVGDVVVDMDYDCEPVSAGIQLAFAIFLARHAYRFVWFCVGGRCRWVRPGEQQ